MSLHTAVATVKTNLGTITLNLYGNHAPKTVANFTGLATGEIEWTHPATGKVSKDKLYDGVIFHRIIKDFMLQAGDPLGQGTGGPGYNFNDEIHPELNFNEPNVRTPARRVVAVRTAHSSSLRPFPLRGCRASTRSSASWRTRSRRRSWMQSRQWTQMAATSRAPRS